jgi:hypothetical protein
MASFTITSIDSTGSGTVTITFDNAQFDGYTDKGKKTKTKVQEFKFDGMPIDTPELLTEFLTEFVSSKINDLDRAEVSQNIADIVGETFAI